jgi:uncharacterized low-complexity protein
MRRRITYANVVATLALVLALSGGAVAASSYLITSTRQIKPNVLVALKGKRGKTGKAGAAGAAGREGKEGPRGATGPEGAVSKLFAVVGATGELVRGDGVTEVANEGMGAYVVTFNQNITSCAYIASVGITGNIGFAEGQADVGGAVGTTNGVTVQTMSPTGTRTEKPFHLVVICP